MKKIWIVVISLITTGLIIFLIKTQITPSPKKSEEVPTPTIAYPTITDDIKITLSAKNNNRIVILKIDGLSPDFESVDYELTYLTGAGLPRGVLGNIVLQGEKEIIRDDIVLGTCSSGNCVYDTGVSKVDLSLKFNSEEKSYIFNKSYPLEPI